MKTHCIHIEVNVSEKDRETVTKEFESAGWKGHRKNEPGRAAFKKEVPSEFMKDPNWESKIRDSINGAKFDACLISHVSTESGA